MGNFTSHDSRHSSPSGGSRRVILWDGTVEEFEEPLTVAELMLEHPQQVVVELQSDSINGKVRPRPLPADQELDPNKLYLMLPKNKRGKPATLAGEEAQRLLLIANTALRARTASPSSLLSSSRFLPLLVKVCAGPGLTAAAASDRCMTRKKKGGGNNSMVIQERKAEVGRWMPEFELPELQDGRPEYLSRQLSGKGWKPSLDPIIEKSLDKRSVAHWLF